MKAKPETRDTREAILDAAEHLFARQGIEGSSLRAITSAAGVNIAAVNYHFGGRDNLVRELFLRRIRPANRERLRRLDELTADGNQPSIEEILRAFIEPVLEVVRGPETADFVKVIGRAHSEPSELIRSIMKEEFTEVFRRFLQAMAVACPELSREDLVWRFQFAVGAMVQMICGPQVSQLFEEGGAPDGEELTDRLITFVTGGFRAPSDSARAGGS